MENVFAEERISKNSFLKNYIMECNVFGNKLMTFENLLYYVVLRYTCIGILLIYAILCICTLSEKEFLKNKAVFASVVLHNHV